MFLAWHRRAGKDAFALNLAADLMDAEPGTYWHLFPLHVQAKRSIFNGIDNNGKRFIDTAFPPDRRKRTVATDTLIEMDNGSIWQMAGSDKYNNLVGANVRGVVFSEWALCDPEAWKFIAPIIRENKGTAIFITTFRGRGHAYRMAMRNKSNPNWYVDIRDITQTTHVDGSPILTEADIDEDRAEGMDEATIQQEYYSNPLAAPKGSIYGKSLEQLELLGRTAQISYDRARPVIAAWHTLEDDQYSVVFAQMRGNEAHVIGSHAYHNQSLSDALEHAKTAFPWQHCSRHVLPAKAGMTTQGVFRAADLTVALSSDTGETIKLTRERLGSTYIDTQERPWCEEQENNAGLIDALNGYKFNDNGRVSPTHHRHLARAFETFAAWRAVGVEAGTRWGRRPSYENHDKALYGRAY